MGYTRYSTRSCDFAVWSHDQLLAGGKVLATKEQREATSLEVPAEEGRLCKYTLLYYWILLGYSSLQLHGLKKGRKLPGAWDWLSRYGYLDMETIHDLSFLLPPSPSPVSWWLSWVPNQQGSIKGAMLIRWGIKRKRKEGEKEKEWWYVGQTTPLREVYSVYNNWKVNSLGLSVDLTH